MENKTALITGVTGQDGAYLAEFLLEKDYTVHGIKRRASLFNTERIDHLYMNPMINEERFRLHYGDLTDSTNMIRIVDEVQPDEIYNLGAQSHVQVSFDTPEYTANVDAVGVLRLLESVRILGMMDRVRFYQASTSELFGNAPESPQSERTPFRPRSPYGVAKLYAYWITVNYREAYGMYACNGVLFNHESPRRDANFVTRKVTRAAARIKLGIDQKLYLGNLDAKRDWGHARDYVKGVWMMLQQKSPHDYVLATGVATSVRTLCSLAFAEAGISLEWEGTGVNEHGRCTETGRILIEVDPHFYRPAEVHHLLGDFSLAQKELGWKPTTTFEELVSEMVQYDLKQEQNLLHLTDKPEKA